MRRKDGIIDGIEEVKGALKKKKAVLERLATRDAALEEELHNLRAQLEKREAEVREKTQWENELLVRAIHAKLELEYELQEHRRIQQAMSKDRVAYSEKRKQLQLQKNSLSSSGMRVRYNKEKARETRAVLTRLEDALREGEGDLAASKEDLRRKEARLAADQHRVEDMTSALEVSVGEMTHALKRVRTNDAATSTHASHTSAASRSATAPSHSSTQGSRDAARAHSGAARADGYR